MINSFTAMKLSQDSKAQKLENFLQENNKPGCIGYGIKQGSDEWKEKKTYTIGGSEIATLIGRNKYQNICNLILSKIGISKFTGNNATRWGNLFEPIIAGYVESKLDCQMVGSDLFLKGAVDHQTYSPDGLGIISIENNQLVFNNKFIASQYPKIKTIDSTLIDKSADSKIVLFEFKCPMNRKLDSQFVPDEYIPQVLTGLNSIPITEHGVYAECSIRRCSWGDLEFTDVFNKTPIMNVDNGIPVAMGFIGFSWDEIYAPLDSTLKKSSKDFVDGKLFDFGKMSVNVLESVLYAMDLKKLDIYYSAINFDNYHLANNIINNTLNIPDDISETFDVNSAYRKGLDKYYKGQLKKDLDQFRLLKNPIGILPWKMFKCNFHIIERDEKFIYNYQQLINDVIEVIKKCKNDMQNYKKIINEFLDTREELKQYKLCEEIIYEE